MCGIAGISLNNPNKIVAQKILEMRNHLVHRGPDSNGSFKQEDLIMIHTRLSIVDLEKGNQPIKNMGYVLVANGEIYNDLQIRKLIKKYKYKTNSDSESIIAIYNEFGLEGINKLRGMYAFALYDTYKDILIISRDEFGIKPLYFSINDYGVIFSSEIKPIINTNIRKYKLDNLKILEFFQNQYCSGRETIYKDILRVRQGETLVIRKGKIIKSFINSIPIKKKNPITVNKKYISDSLEESISTHLRSDVPYCLFFSGGIDSTLILYTISKILSGKLTAYSISFDKKKNFHTQKIRKIIKPFNVQLNEILFTEEDFWNYIPFSAEKIDDPIADYAVLPTFKMSSIVSKSFKVVLSGEGGDELFGGYGRYRAASRFLFNKKLSSRSGSFSKLNMFKKYKKEWNYFFQNNFSQEDSLINFSKFQESQIHDYNHWLPNNLLVKLDRCLMNFGLEGRTPLIDKEIFQKFFLVDDKIKVRGRIGKFYIREYLQSCISSYNAFEKKSGFTVPIFEWIPKKSKYLRELIPQQEILRYFFSRDDLYNLCKSAELDRKYVKPLWHLIFFSSWYLINVVGKKAEGNYFDLISNN